MSLWRIVLLCLVGFDILIAEKRELPDPLSDPEKLFKMDDIINFDYLKDIEDIIKSKISLQPMLPKLNTEKETKELSFADLLKAPADADVQVTPEFLADIYKSEPKIKSPSKPKKKHQRKLNQDSIINFKQLMELDRFLHSKAKSLLEDDEQKVEKINFKDILNMGYRKEKRKQAKRKKNKKDKVLDILEYNKESAPELAADLKLSLKSLISQLESRNEEMNIKELIKILKSRKYVSDTSESESDSDKETVDPGPLMKLKPLKHKSKNGQSMSTNMKKKKKNTRVKLTENEMKNMAKIISLERMIRPKKSKKQRKTSDKIKKQSKQIKQLVEVPQIPLGRIPGLEALVYSEKNNSKDNAQNEEEEETIEETTTEEDEGEETETTFTTDPTDTTESDTTETDDDETTETDTTDVTTTLEMDTEEVENATVAEVEIEDAPLDR